MEYIKQHSLYITLACATVPVLLVSTPNPPPPPPKLNNSKKKKNF